MNSNSDDCICLLYNIGVLNVKICECLTFRSNVHIGKNYIYLCYCATLSYDQYPLLNIVLKIVLHNTSKRKSAVS